MANFKISITDFTFTPLGSGYYWVTYTSPTTGKTWIKTIRDIGLIDRTRNADEPQKKDLHLLKHIIKRG